MGTGAPVRDHAGPRYPSEQLLDGYGEIAHVLIGEPAGCPAETVSRHVEAMLAEPGSQPAPAVRGGRRSELLPGHLQAAERAARYAGELGQDAVAAIYRIARHGYLQDFARIRSQMTTLGYPDPEPPRPSVKTPRSVGEALDLWEDREAFFTAAASLETPRVLTVPNNGDTPTSRPWTTPSAPRT